MSIIRTRIAPSPTGNLHIGTARSALFNYLFAKANKGEFILRIEDTDLERSDEKFTQNIIEGLQWLGIKWDKGPFKQSERLDIYKKYLQKLLDEGKAYYCFCAKEELEKEREEQEKRGEATKYSGKCANLEKEEVEKMLDLKKPYIIRLKSPIKKIIFKDLIRGELEFDTAIIGDIAIAKNLDTPLYNFAVVIDDYEMEISHVIRGEDHISNTPKQILIQEALGLPRPEYAHLPMVLGPDKSKLSKRHGATSINEYRDVGYLPEALINFIAFIGWNPKTEQEIFSIEELVDNFSIDKIQKGGAVFNIEKLDWMNSQYIHKMSLDDFANACLPYLPAQVQKENFDFIKKAVALEQQRIKKLSEIGESIQFIFADNLEYEPEILIWKKSDKEEAKTILEQLKKLIATGSEADLENIIMTLAKEKGTGNVMWPLRVALSGKIASPGPIEIARVIGREKTIKRIEFAIKQLSF